jgi:hypothetical protein
VDRRERAGLRRPFRAARYACSHRAALPYHRYGLRHPYAQENAVPRLRYAAAALGALALLAPPAHAETDMLVLTCSLSYEWPTGDVLSTHASMTGTCTMSGTRAGMLSVVGQRNVFLCGPTFGGSYVTFTGTDFSLMTTWTQLGPTFLGNASGTTNGVITGVMTPSTPADVCAVDRHAVTETAVFTVAGI